MRLTIPWKMVLATSIPLAAVALGVGMLAYRAIALRSTAELEARTQRLAESIAAQLNAQVTAAAQVARCTASFVAAAPDLSEAQIGEVLASALREEPIIYGACVAFEPYAFDPQRRLVAPYVFRRDGEVRTMDVGAEAYDYTEEKWDWYRAPRETGRPAWTEPYFDLGAGDTLMCTYGVPIVRDGTTIGVATVDVPIAELQQRLWIDRFEAGSFFLLSSRGTFVSAPDASLVRTTTLAELAAREGRDDLRRLSELMLAGRRGIMHMNGFGGATAGRAGAMAGDAGDRASSVATSTSAPTTADRPGRPTWFVVAPVATPRWSLAVMLPDVEALSDEKREFDGSVTTLALATAAVLGCVWLAGRRVARPIDDFSRTADAVSRGNLDVVAPVVPGRDELGALSTSFDRMIGELRRRNPKELREQVEREVRAEVRSQLEAQVGAQLESRFEAQRRETQAMIEERVELEVAQRLAREVASTGRRLVGPTAPTDESPAEASADGDDEAVDPRDGAAPRDGDILRNAPGAARTDVPDRAPDPAPSASAGRRSAERPPDRFRDRFDLRRSGGDPLEHSGDLLDAVTRRDGSVILLAIGAAGAGLAASTAAITVRMLLRGLAEATDDPARMLVEAARLARGLAQPVSAAVAVCRPDEGRVQVAIAGDSGAKVIRANGDPVTIAAPTEAIGDTVSPSPPATATVSLGPGDRLTLRSRSNRHGDVAMWTLTRR
ncbi:MAG: HAMP domain-containing protein [Phycisphaerales bacterium]